MTSLISYIEQYKALELSKVVDYEKFNSYAITAHSTQIEGSTLTQEETSLLIDEGITPKGKPLEHSLMVTDHDRALQLALNHGTEKSSISTHLIQEINSVVMKSTGQVYRTALGDVDASKGELRKGQVFVGSRYFPSYEKVKRLLNELTQSIDEKIKSVSADDTLRQLELSFSSHFNLVSIHPFYDGNGRTSRLLMNLLQKRFDLPLAIVYKEDKLEYYQALEDSRNSESIAPFDSFMKGQYLKFLRTEIDLYKSQISKDNSGSRIRFLF